MLDFDTCNEARLRRDPAYDGVFFIAVRTTRIYCRPVCPVRPPLTKNVHFFSSAGAAERAGYRPCLRCRPESAPFSPAWLGTEATVERALRLIEEGALDRDSVEAFANRLGIGARHLTRLFDRYVGASPIQVARTMRMQKAKRLIDQGELSISDIALASGFRSVRSFNTACLALYGRSPKLLRRQKREGGPNAN